MAVKKKEINNGVTQFNGDVIVNGNVDSLDSSNLVTKTQVLQVNASLGRKSTEALKQTVATMAEDMKLTPAEKVLLADEWAALQARHATLFATAGTLAILSETAYTDYLAAYSALSTYMGTLLANMNESTPIVRAEYDTIFDNYFLTVAVLTELITQKENVSYQDLQEGFENEYGTKIPEAPVLRVQMDKRMANLLWTKQVNLSPPHTWDVQVSEDQVKWYALDFTGADWKVGSAGGYTGGQVIPGLTQTNIPNVESGGVISARTLYWRVRVHLDNETLSPYVSAWSNAVTGATTPISYEDMGPNSVGESQIQQDSVTEQAIKITSLTSIDTLGELAENLGISQAYADYLAGGNTSFSNGFEDDDIGNWVERSGDTVCQDDDCYSDSKAGLFSSVQTAPTSSGSTGSTNIVIPANRAMKFSGRMVRISVWAKQPSSAPAAEFAIAYSTNAVGNSGWHKFTPTTSWQRFSFDYLVPEGTNGTDYLGIWGDTSGFGLGTLIDVLVIEYAESAVEEYARTSLTEDATFISNLFTNSLTADVLAAQTAYMSNLTADSGFISALFANTFTARKITASELAAGTITASELATDVLDSLIAQIHGYVMISEDGFVGTTYDNASGGPVSGSRRAYLDEDEITFQSYDGSAWNDTIKLGGVGLDIEFYQAGSRIGYGLDTNGIYYFSPYEAGLTSTLLTLPYSTGVVLASDSGVAFKETDADNTVGYFDLNAAILYWGGKIDAEGDIYAGGTAYWGDGKEIVRFSDSWLRLNQDNDFPSGIFCGSGILRTDGRLQVGGGGAYFEADSAGVNIGVATDIAAALTAQSLGVDGNVSAGGIVSTSEYFSGDIRFGRQSVNANGTIYITEKSYIEYAYVYVTSVEGQTVYVKPITGETVSKVNRIYIFNDSPFGHLVYLEDPVGNKIPLEHGQGAWFFLSSGELHWASPGWELIWENRSSTAVSRTLSLTPGTYRVNVRSSDNARCYGGIITVSDFIGEAHGMWSAVDYIIYNKSTGLLLAGYAPYYLYRVERWHNGE